MTEGLPVVFSELEDISSDTDCEINRQIKELQHEFHEALAEHPQIIKYIDRLHTIIRRQQKKLNKFYKKLKDHKFVKKHEIHNKESQTEDRIQDEEVKSEITVLDSARNTPWNFLEEATEKNIIDEVKEVAENAMKHTGFVYEPTSGMYYDYNTGYYYNAELRMYYDGNTGRYLEYDEETKTYKYHSTGESEILDKPSHLISNSFYAKVKKKGGKPKWDVIPEVDALGTSLSKLSVQTARNAIDEAEEGEITESSVSGSDNSDSDEGKKSEFQDSGFGCNPCMRLMVEETHLEKLKVGSLFVVTCKGGTLGREGDHAVLIPDINVSKHHAKFVFDQETSSYYVTDLGSRNGTWLDGERLSAALQESKRFEISHGTIIQIGTTKLLCHVHVGRETCPSCEPGVVQQMSDSMFCDSGTKNSEYWEQLQNLKKKFGVDGINRDVFKVPGYEDRAEARRTTVGSSHSYEKTQIASVSEFIPQCNKGFKMLSKMGWSEGQKLGKNDTGLTEPVPLLSNSGKSGFGMSSGEVSKPCKSTKKKLEILKKTQDRYRNLELAGRNSDEDHGH